MTVLPIIVAPDPRLKTRSEPVDSVTDEIRTLAEDMLETMYASNGIGLAAVQVGELKRMIVVDVEAGSSRYDLGKEDGASSEGGNPLVLINPEIIDASDEQHAYDEGCLSFPGQYSEVERPDTVTIAYTDLDGNRQELKADGILSTCIQHEIDHMNGVVFVDHISRVKRDMILRKVKKTKKLQESEA